MSALLVALVALGAALLSLGYAYVAYVTARDAECERIHFEPLPVPYLSTAEALTEEEVADLLDRWKSGPSLKPTYVPSKSDELGLLLRHNLDELGDRLRELKDGMDKVAAGSEAADLAEVARRNAHNDPFTGTGHRAESGVDDPTVKAPADSAQGGSRPGAVGAAEVGR